MSFTEWRAASGRAPGEFELLTRRQSHNCLQETSSRNSDAVTPNFIFSCEDQVPLLPSLFRAQRLRAACALGALTGPRASKLHPGQERTRLWATLNTNLEEKPELGTSERTNPSPMIQRHLSMKNSPFPSSLENYQSKPLQAPAPAKATEAFSNKGGE